MTLQLNPDTTDGYESKTLAQMRQMIFDGLGFETPLSFLYPRTMAELRTAVITACGFIDPLVVAGRTLFEIRQSIINRLGLAVALSANTDSYTNVYNDVYAALGYAGMSSPPPGVATLIATWISQAQSTLLSRIEFDWKGVARTPLFTSGNSLIDATPIRLLAIAYGKAHDGSPDASGWLQQAERYLADITQRTPPNIVGVVNSAIIGAHNIVYRRFELGLIGAVALAATFGHAIATSGNYADTASDTDVSQVDDTLVETLALANLKEKIGQPDAKMFAQEYEQAIGDLLKRSPPNLKNIVTTALTSANETIFRRYEQGNSGPFANSQTALSGTGRFTQDTDRPTVDDQAVYLLALSETKLRFGVPDPKLAVVEFDQYMKDMYRRMPPNATSVVNQTLKMTQQQLYRKYDVFRMERWWTWSLVAGQRFYGTFGDDNAKSLAPTGLTAVQGSAVASHNMTVKRSNHTATTLLDGRVLLAGGNSFVPTGGGNILSSVEIFDPVVGQFSATGSLIQARSSATAVRLQSGKVLIVGGVASVTLTSVEIYDPSTGQFSSVGNMTRARSLPVAQLLDDGRVLIVGGDFTGGTGNSAEIYDPSNNSITPTGDPIQLSRQQAFSSILPNGLVLVGGGTHGGGLSTAELYDPVAGAFSSTGALPSIYYVGAIATTLLTGDVLIVGSLNLSNNTVPLIYSSGSGTFSTTGSAVAGRFRPSVNLLSDGTVLIAGGFSGSTELNTAEIFDPKTAMFTATSNNMSDSRRTVGATIYNNNKVLLAGGIDNAIGAVNTADIYDIATGMFSATGSLTAGTVFYQITAFTANGESLPSPEVFVAGIPSSTAVNLSWTPVPKQPFVTGYGIYGRVTGGTKQLIARVSVPATTYVDAGTIPPDGALPIVNETQGPGALDPRHVTWVGLSFNDNVWNPLIKGIPPMAFAQNINGVPTNYEIRQSLEIWPAPTTTDWKVQVKGYFQPMIFENDDDLTTLDWQAIYLQGLADSMPRFKQLSGAPLFNQLEVAQAQSNAANYVKRLVAGTHMTARYIPGVILQRNATRPVLAGPYVGYP